MYVFRRNRHKAAKKLPDRDRAATPLTHTHTHPHATNYVHVWGVDGWGSTTQTCMKFRLKQIDECFHVRWVYKHIYFSVYILPCVSMLVCARVCSHLVFGSCLQAGAEDSG